MKTGAVLGTVSGTITLFFAFLFAGTGYWFAQTAIAEILQPTMLLKTLFTSFISIHLLIGILSIASAALIKDPCHSKTGAKMLIAFNTIGILTGAGFFIGSIIGISGGVLEIAE